MRKNLFTISTLALAISGSQAIAESLVLEEVVVTAQKRSQGLQEVPIAVTMISGEQNCRSRYCEFGRPDYLCT